MDPITLGIMGGSLALNAATEYERNRKRRKMVGPEAARKLMTLSAGDLNQIRQPFVRDVGAQTMATRAAIKQAGAANRAPAGAVMSSLAGANYEGGRALGEIEPKLAAMKRQGNIDWLNYRNQYNEAENAGDQAMFDNLSATLGTSTKLAALQRAGFFDDDDDSNDGLYKYNFGGSASRKPKMKRSVPETMSYYDDDRMFA